MTKVVPKKVEVNDSFMTCDKCGSIMVNKILFVKNGNNGIKKEKIYQCIVCRHWLPQE